MIDKKIIEKVMLTVGNRIFNTKKAIKNFSKLATEIFYEVLEEENKIEGKKL